MGKVFTDPFGIKEAQKKQAESQRQAQQFAQQQATEAKAEQARIEEKYGLTPGELDREERTFALEKEREGALRGRAGRPGEELLREGGGGITSGLLDIIKQRLGKSGRDLFLEEGGQPAQDYYNRVTSPTDQGILSNELELARQMVNQEANRRGVFGGLPEGGIRFEQLGRAGVDLAIKSAREKMAQQQSLASGFINLAQGARAEAGTAGERSLTASDMARRELDSFLANQQGFTAGARGRASNVALGAAGIADRGAERSYDTISSIYGQQFGQAAKREQAGLNTLGDLSQIALSYGLAPATGGASLYPIAATLPGSLPFETTQLRVTGALPSDTSRLRLPNNRLRQPGIFNR